MPIAPPITSATGPDRSAVMASSPFIEVPMIHSPRAFRSSMVRFRFVTRATFT